MNLERRHLIWDRTRHALFLFVFCVSAFGVEVTEKQVQFYMSKPGFQGMISAIVRVNQAMRTAAENPMDKWRREDVRKAMAAMPGAIKGLAGEFFSGSLHDGDFPAIQSMMGGFVDVSAADAYKKFLRNPDPSLIPKVGANFPGNLNAPAPPSPAEHRSGDAHVHGAGHSDPHGHDHGQTNAIAKSGELVDLGRDLASIVEGSSGNKAGEEGSRGIHFNEQAESDSLLQKAINGLGGVEGIAAQANNPDAVANAESTSAESAPNNFVQGVAMDLSSLEEEEEECDPEDDDCELGDEKIFELSEDKKEKQKTEKKNVKKEKQESKKQKKVSLNPFKYELKKKAKKWRASSILWPQFLLPTEAKAETQSMAICLRCLESRGRTNRGLLECRNAGLCSSEDLRFLAQSGALGGGGLGGPGGLGGGGLSPQNQRLLALHQIVAASAAMTTAIVAATSRADADKHQALMHFFKTTIPTAIQADTQKFLAANQASINAAINATTLFNYKVQQDGRREREALLLDAAFRNKQFQRQQNLLDNLQKDYFAHQDFLLKMTMIGNQAELTKTATLAKAYTQNMSGPPTTLPVASVATSNGEMPTRQPFFSSVGVGSNNFPSSFRRGISNLYAGQRSSVRVPSSARPSALRSVTHGGYRHPSALRPIHWGFRSPLRQK